MTPETFFHVALKVEDVDEAAAFYRDTLDGSLIDRGHAGGETDASAVEYAALEVADKRVYVFDRAPYEAAGLVDPLPTGFLHFGYVVEDVERAMAELPDGEVEVVMEPTVFGDLKVAFFRDPGGVRIEFIEYL